MIRNFFKILIRNIIRQKFYASINIFRLTIGMAISLLIVIFIMDEYSYDNFHPDAKQIYRVDLNGRMGNQEFNSAYTASAVVDGLLREILEIEKGCRIAFWDNIQIQRQEYSFVEKQVMLADSNFFDFFTFKLLAGNKKDVLTGPNKIVLAESAARKIAGSNEFNYNDIIGKMLLMGTDNRSCMITGIAEDPPENSHFHFTVILSMDSYGVSKNPSWVNNNLISYIKKNNNATQQQIESKFPEIIKKYLGPQIQQALGISFEEFFKQGGKYKFYLEPITSIHLNSAADHDLEPGGNMNTIFILVAIASFIIIIASIKSNVIAVFNQAINKPSPIFIAFFVII